MLYRGWLNEAGAPCGGFPDGTKKLQSEIKLCKCITPPATTPPPATQTDNTCYNSYTTIGCGVSNSPSSDHIEVHCLILLHSWMAPPLLRTKLAATHGTQDVSLANNAGYTCHRYTIY